MAKRILVPLNQGERAESVLPIVRDMALAGGATVRLLHVAPLPEMRMDASGRVIAYANQESDRLEWQGRDYLRLIGAQLDGVPVESAVRFGNPEEEILLEAEAFGADLVALTTGKPGWSPRPGVGRVAGRVLRKSETPVMLLSAGPER